MRTFTVCGSRLAWLVLALCCFGLNRAHAKTLKMLYIRGEFSDKSIAISDKVWRERLSKLHARLDNYWQRNSFQKISKINATISKLMKFPEAFSAYRDVQKLRRVMRAMATAAGHDLAQFDHVVYCYPSIPHSISFGALGSPGNIWLPGDNPFDGGLIHEFGHALGVGHANSIEGAKGVIYPGQRREGRDGLFMMGSDGGDRIGDFSCVNLPMAFKMGFIDQKHIKTAKKSGVYRIWESELEELPSSRALAVRLDVEGRDFWLSFAPKMVERWAKFDSKGFARGILVHRLVGSVTEILDFTPGSFKGTKNEEDYKDTRDGALQIGQSFTFPGTTIRLVPMRIGRSRTPGEIGLRYIDVKIDLGLDRFFALANKPQGTKISTQSGQFQLDSQNTAVKIQVKSGDIWDKHDSFYFVNRPLQQSTVNQAQELRATVTEFRKTNTWAKAGLMIRDSLAANAKHVSVFVTPERQVVMQWRSESGEMCRSSRPVQAGRQVVQLKIRRSGKSVTAFYSVDDRSWKAILTLEFAFAKTARIGLAVSSNNTKAATTVQFLNVYAKTADPVPSKAKPEKEQK